MIIGNKKKDYLEIFKLKMVDLCTFILIAMSLWTLKENRLFFGGLGLGYSLCLLISMHISFGIKVNPKSPVGYFLRRRHKC